MLRVSLLVATLAIASDARADVGAMVDAGVPSGAGASLVYRPIGAVSMYAGAAHNGIGPGVGGGVSVAPFGSLFRPTLTLEGGRFFERDSNAAVEQLLGEPSALAPERFGYDYGTAHLGFELGTRRFAFYLRGGVSYVRASWHSDDTNDEGTVTTMAEAELRTVTPSARLGFLISFGG